MMHRRYHIARQFRAVLLTHLHVALFSDKDRVFSDPAYTKFVNLSI
jgi:hypothetical protein